jgi:hypothetical protein
MPPILGTLVWDADCRRRTVDYGIVTRAMFAKTTALDRFVTWKRSQGRHVGVVTLEWVDAHVQGPDIAAKTKRVLLEMKARAGLKEVLLVGDDEFALPPGYTSGWCDTSSHFDLSKPWNVPSGPHLGGQWIQFSDFYYADRHLFDVDPQGHPYVPSPCYLDFDLRIGRFAVRTEADLLAVVDKTMRVSPVRSVLTVIAKAFSQTPDPCHVWPPTPGNWMEEDAAYCPLPYAIDRALAGTGITHQSHVFDPLVQSERDQARSLIFASDALLVVSSHGGRDGNQFFCDTDIPSFQHTIPFYLASSCLVNAFENTWGDSLTESMIKAPASAGSAAYPVNCYHFFRALARGTSVGEALFSPRRIYYGGGIALQNLLGDPSLRLLG